MIHHIQKSGIFRGLDNPLEFDVKDGRIVGPSSYRVEEPVEIQNGVVTKTRIVVKSSEEIRQHLQDLVDTDAAKELTR